MASSATISESFSDPPSDVEQRPKQPLHISRSATRFPKHLSCIQPTATTPQNAELESKHIPPSRSHSRLLSTPFLKERSWLSASGNDLLPKKEPESKTSGDTPSTTRVSSTAALPIFSDLEDGGQDKEHEEISQSQGLQ